MTMIPPSSTNPFSFENLSRLLLGKPLGGSLGGLVGTGQVKATLNRAAIGDATYGEGSKPKAEDVLARVDLSQGHPFNYAAYILKGEKPQVVYEQEIVGGFVGGQAPEYSKPMDLPAGIAKDFDWKTLAKPAPKFILADTFGR